jgi:hypothetical protein
MPREESPSHARTSQNLAPDAAGQVDVSGTVVSDAGDGTHELALTVVNSSPWSLTELRVWVQFEVGSDPQWKEYVLRSRGTVGPGESEVLSARIEGGADYGLPPAWSYGGATGYPPRP